MARLEAARGRQPRLVIAICFCRPLTLSDNQVDPSAQDYQRAAPSIGPPTPNDPHPCNACLNSAFLCVTECNPRRGPYLQTYDNGDKRLDHLPSMDVHTLIADGIVPWCHKRGGGLSNAVNNATEPASARVDMYAAR
ncbi:uncharacterized protein BO66DRAFT_72194 [Aspergillus aculeatinus CBS 121060]|uniref:Uncharacterized protein n=1 Tax=Aspergillus aculeatinus CBS 121060 TaxID=1448322 RepID=A0ACD1HB63_9EURO|nr:hypothetical protein BO66DRAFT_72194 [Aspergillus aculeatinus CBS 121060]RAH70797.1 hypothetical protein BO66DRAFT_72194 [Aspergillus aculeatinus CBS 121060]